jgi:RNA polymerase sigma-70 factor (ECF subfamily)
MDMGTTDPGLMAGTAPDDRELARRAQGGEGAALGLLYDRHVDYVHRYLRRYAPGDPATAEDLVHDTFIRVIRAFDDGRFDPEHEGEFRGWLTRIAANIYRDHARRQARRAAREEPMRHDEDPETFGWEPAAPFQADPLPPIELDALLDTLPPQARRVMRFRRQHPELSEAESAERLGMGLEAYRKTVRRAFSRLREQSGARREELLDATYPWQNRGEEASPFAVPATADLDPAARARIRAALLEAQAALHRQVR